MTDRILNPVVWLAAFALAIFGFIQAERAVQKAYRWVRFHLGRVPADGAPLDKREAMALVAVRRDYRRPTAPERVYQQAAEDWWSE